MNYLSLEWNKIRENLLPIMLDSWHFFKQHFFSICIIVLPFTVLIGLLSESSNSYKDLESIDDATYFFIHNFLIILLPIFYIPALICFISLTQNGEKYSVLQCFHKSLKRVPTFFLLSFLTVIPVAIGFYWLAILGYYALARIIFAEFHCVVNGKGAWRSLVTGFKDSHEYQWLLSIGIALISYANKLIIYVFDLLTEELGASLSKVILHEVILIFGVISTIFCFKVFTLKMSQNNESLGQVDAR